MQLSHRLTLNNRTRRALERLHQADQGGNIRLIRRTLSLLYKVFGLIDFFTGRLFYRGHTGRFNSDSYAEFLLEVMQQTLQHLISIQDGAKYHTSKAMQQFFHEHADRVTMFQLPSYSPDFNPIEFLWKKVKKHATHLRYFPHFDKLVEKVEDTLLRLANTPSEIMALMGWYCESLGEVTE